LFSNLATFFTQSYILIPPCNLHRRLQLPPIERKAIANDSQLGDFSHMHLHTVLLLSGYTRDAQPFRYCRPHFVYF